MPISLTCSAATKECSKCRKTKDASEFYRMEETRDRLHCHCKECVRSKSRLYSLQNRDSKRAYHTKWRSENREHIRSAQQKRRNANQSVTREKQRAYDRTRLARPDQKLKKNYRTRVWMALRGVNKSATTQTLLGCSIPFLRQYLEKQFTPEMSWANYGSYWSVDHKRPCASFDLLDPVQQRECFHYSNLQPLEKIANIRKSDTPCLSL